MPTFPGPPGRIDEEGYAGKALGNEYSWLFHLNEIAVPSIVLPTAVFHGDSGIPASVLLYGLNDLELLGIAQSLEAGLKVTPVPTWPAEDGEGEGEGKEE